MNKDLPTVSIVTPVLNNKDAMEFVIQSGLSQRYKNIEYIVVDGGSTDGTVDSINGYRDQIAKFVSESDRGIYDGMNKGIGLASGEVVGILNSDDVYTSNEVVETVVEKMKQSNADVCWGDLVYVEARDPNKVIRYWRSSGYEPGKFRKGWMPPHPTFFVRKQLYEEYGSFNLDFPTSADYELMLRLLEKHKVKSCYIPQVLVRMRAGGESNRSIKNIIKANVECYRAWEANGLTISPFRMLLKPLSKIPQFIGR